MVSIKKKKNFFILIIGETYRGHIFWDEIFVATCYNIRFPEASKSLLLYRYHRLNTARDIAREVFFFILFL